MYTFKDFYHNTVELSFEKHPFSPNPKHVWVICKYKDQWLLTDHQRRGFEFPGGKVEEGESPEQAAVREVLEETGGSVSSINYLGQYRVTGKDKIIIKNIYFANIGELLTQQHYFETNGPVLFKEFPPSIKKDRRFSFIMRDEVFSHSLSYLNSIVKDAK